MSKRFPGRRLSVPRLIGVFVVTGGLIFAGLQGLQWVNDSSSVTSKPWLAGYVDVTATPSYAFETPANESGKNVVLSFIVAATADPCQPSWGTYYSMEEADAALDLDRRIARTTQLGGEVVISFGGQLNDELATGCTDPESLKRAYSSVIDRYKITTIDLDIEGANLSDTAAGERRAMTLATLQKERATSETPLAIWVTLPVAPTGLTAEGTDAVAQLLSAGVDLAGVNVMTMDYGGSLPKGDSMSTASIDALNATHKQLGTLYNRAGIVLGPKALWSKMGATPMIGQNDVAAEIFSLDDARVLNEFATSKQLGRMSLWSLNRDTTCGSNYPDVTRVSDSCSGVDQGAAKFADVLGASFVGVPKTSAGIVTTSEPTPRPQDLKDDPAKSPYPIWSSNNAYPKGSKIVWHRNVYVAKYWTKGDLPDNPVLQASETPWELVGPVLPGEKPVPVPTLPPDTYPEWVGAEIYTKGDRVLFNDGAYEAKWWTQGDSPEAEASNPDSTPWLKLTDNQVREILGLPPVGNNDDER